MILQNSFNLSEYKGKPKGIHHLELFSVKDQFGNQKKNVRCTMKLGINHSKGSQRKAIKKIMSKVVLTEICASGLPKNKYNQLIVKCGRNI